MNNLLGLFRSRDHAPDVELLSQHLDGRLDAAAAARLDAHLQSCEACTVRLAGLRAARDAVRSLPEAEPPRSFRLRPSDVQTAPRPHVAPPLVRAMPALSAAAVIVFAAVLGADLYRSGGGSSDSSAPTGLVPMASGDRSDYSSAAPEKSIDGGAQAGTDASAPGGGTNGPTNAPAAADVGAATATPAPEEAARAQPTPAFRDSADRAPEGPSNGGSDRAFRITEVLAAAIAVIAAATVIVWRVRRREV